jgi:hypothetical protein
MQDDPIVANGFAVLHSGKVHMSSFLCMAHVGGNTSPVSGEVQPQSKRICPLVLDYITGQRGTEAHREGNASTYHKKSSGTGGGVLVSVKASALKPPKVSCHRSHRRPQQGEVR